MAMPYRAPRDVDFTSKSTPSTVGPGSYNIPVMLKTKNVIPNMTGFISSEERKLGGGKGINDETPGPGAYSVNASHPIGGDGTGSSAFKATAPRFAQPPSNTPGPGRYNVNIGWTPIKKKISASTTPRGGSNPQSKYDQFRNQKTFPVPAIPRPNQSNGYEEKEGGIIVPQSSKINTISGIGNDTVGPGHYNPKYDALYSSRGAFVDISRNQVERQVFIPSSNPGPGYYEVTVPGGDIFNKTQIGVVEDYKFSAVFASRVPNCADKKEDLNTQTPGPGSYSIDRGIGRVIYTKAEKSMNATKPFGTEAERKGWENNIETPYSRPTSFFTPGPGAYGSNGRSDPPSKIYYQQFRRAKTARKPQNLGFNSVEERDCLTSSQEEPNLGPGCYNIDHESTSLKGKLQKTGALGKKGVFGTTTNRFYGSVTYQAEKLGNFPGPGQYDSKTMDRNYKEVRSVFLSKTQRFTDQKGYNQVNNNEEGNGEFVAFINDEPVQRQHFEGEIQVKKRIKASQRDISSPFSSSASRFRRNTIFATQTTDELTTPGPGTYDSHKVLKWGKESKTNNGLVSFLSNERRFRDPVEINSVKEVGPGSYDTPNYLIKKSFNVTMTDTKIKKKKRNKKRHKV